MQNIQIKILNNREFDGLPLSATRGADISDSIGFADVPNRRIYVRDCGRDELNRLVVQHEMDHLFELEGTDEDPHVEGIRHKKARDFFRLFWDPRTITNPNIGQEERKAQNAANDAAQAEQQAQQAAQSQQQSLMQEQQQSSLTGPLGQFQVASTPGTNKVPSGTGGGPAIQGGINNGLLQSPNSNQTDTNGVSSGLLERVKGFFSGRSSF